MNGAFILTSELLLHVLKCACIISSLICKYFKIERIEWIVHSFISSLVGYSFVDNDEERNSSHVRGIFSQLDKWPDEF